MSNQKRGIHLIAELAKVSIGTVDRALHQRGEINKNTRRRILQIAQRLGYTPNLSARALSVAKPSACIGVSIPQEIRFFYDQLFTRLLDQPHTLIPLRTRF